MQTSTQPSVSLIPVQDNIQFSSTPESWLGRPYPLGATYDGKGVNFAVFSEHAEAVELCLFDRNNPSVETARIQIIEQTDFIWHIYIPAMEPGQLYGYRVYGPYNPAKGQLFNPSNLLLDPYAKAICGDVVWHTSMFGYDTHSDAEDRFLQPNYEDSSAHTLKSVVIDDAFDWEGDQPPCIPMHKSVIYEGHVKGITMLHPDIDPALRGTYAGLASPVIIDYLKRLGITAIELMPVHQFIHDGYLVDKGLRNYWGYNSIGFFAPHNEYSASGQMGEQVTEFKKMIKEFHRHGIEVILDVVYNHTAEGNHYGPLLSLKGLDNEAYYRIVEGEPTYYMDFTGTGNTINLLHPNTLRMVMDSLRYWVTEMHVDGFRFDLASALARGLYEVGKLSTFLDTIHQDPVISQVKLIAEPWDIGEGGYQVGNFPVQWAEWNAKYRDTIRRYWKGDKISVAEMAYRLTGSSDLYETTGRLPSASINFVIAHDGFTLHDLVSYNEKHNEANGEDNRDGYDANESWNSGVEGETDDAGIIQFREKRKRNFLTTLLLSQGVPMVCGGDEYGRTQHGNNNAYCHDDKLSWHHWDWSPRQTHLYEFVCQLAKLRHESPVFHRRRFFTGRPIHGEGITDVRWITQQGKDISEKDWEEGIFSPMGMLLDGHRMEEYDENGQRIQANVFLLLLNNENTEVGFTLPGKAHDSKWHVVMETQTGRFYPGQHYACQETIPLPGHSLILLKQG